MDNEAKAALAAINEQLATLIRSVEFLGGRQVVIGERLQAIEALLAPDEGPKGPSTAELLEDLTQEVRTSASSLAQEVRIVGQAVQEVPAETLRCIAASARGPERNGE